MDEVDEVDTAMPSNRDTFPRDAEEARLDVELTRQELGQTADALATKARQAAYTTQRAALAASAAVAAAVLLMVIIRKLVGR